MLAANHSTAVELKKRDVTESELPVKRFFERAAAKLKGSKAVLLMWGAFCTMLTISSAIDPLGGEMSRRDRSVHVLTGNTFIKE